MPALDGMFTDADPDGLRWYQREAVTAILAMLALHRSTLLVMATGTGKTETFGAVAKHWPGRVLVLAHRDELVTQARRRLERMTGEYVQVEKAQFTSTPGTRIVVASVQTLAKQKRLDALGPDRFDLIIIDEGHHAAAVSYKKIVAYFANAKVLGVTATPKRGDKKALKPVFDSVAYTFEIEAAIDQGYLVPLACESVTVPEINLEGITKTADDLAAGQLDEMMIKAVEGCVKGLLERCPGKQTVLFFPGVKSAELACARLNELHPGSAIFICGKTEEDERKQMVRDFHAGRCQYLCNCAIATEGFDAPTVEVVAIARPTLSPALLAQMVGRGTRPESGILDDCEGPGLHDLRRHLIATSKKPQAIILDFVGQREGKYQEALASVVDILGGSFSEAERKAAKKKMKETGGTDPRKALEAARAELKALAKSVKSTVKVAYSKFNPFSVMHMKEVEPHQLDFAHQPMSKEQHSALTNYGLSKDQVAVMGRFDAQRFIMAQRARMKAGLCTYRQLVQLQRYGCNEINVPFARAKAAMNYLEQTAWAGRHMDPKKLDAIVHYRREPGED